MAASVAAAPKSVFTRSTTGKMGVRVELSAVYYGGRLHEMMVNSFSLRWRAVADGEQSQMVRSIIMVSSLRW